MHECYKGWGRVCTMKTSDPTSAPSTSWGAPNSSSRITATLHSCWPTCTGQVQQSALPRSFHPHSDLRRILLLILKSSHILMHSVPTCAVILQLRCDSWQQWAAACLACDRNAVHMVQAPPYGLTRDYERHTQERQASDRMTVHECEPAGVKY